ncbi:MULTISPECIES: NHL repeat-containing protein [Bacteroides]|uniref:hypothetical protein n=1 Tax=Bacteroides TaxID=816 RepID=UPI0004BB0420|nr:hypothetical protein [Bacteroides neonati]MCP3894796.1 hypothetical protein [Bacteroides sp.]
MKIKQTLIALFALFVAAGCSKEELIPETENENYTSHYYYSYVAQSAIDAAALGLAPGEYVPGPVCQHENVLYIANNKEGMQSVILYNIQTKQKIKTLRSWTYQEREQTFPNNKIEAISVSNGRLYVANIGSQIDVFDSTADQFITRIGTGQWGDGNTQMLHAHAMLIRDGYIYVRTKNCMQVYRESDITPANYMKVPYYCKSSTAGFDTNNGFNPYQMFADEKGIYVTDFGQYGNKKLTYIQPDKVEQGSNKELIDSEKTLSFDFNMVGAAPYQDHFFLIQSNGTIHLYDCKKGQVTHTFTTLFGAKLQKAQRIVIDEDRMWITDIAANKLYEVKIITNEIKESE